MLSFAVSATLSMFAVTTPAIYEGGGFKCFSPNGNYAIQDPGTHAPMVIMDLVNNLDYPYIEEYEGGNGNCISNHGTVVGYALQKEQAYYWQNGNWNRLNVPATTVLSYANGITPDGKRIVGSISPSSYGGDYEGLMLMPVYWELNSSGNYDGPFTLPYPNIDFTNRTPQAVSALRISDDGKIIAGQMRDYLGLVCQPVIFTQDDSGNWNYKLLINDVFHPEGYTVPPFPEEAPTQQDFMTEEEIKAYEAAVAEWESAPQNDSLPYPDIYEFMTDEEISSFMEAAIIWNLEYEEFNTALWDLIAVVPNFSYNNVYMNSDGTKYATTDAKFFRDEGRDIEIKEFTPYLIDITTDTYKSYPREDGVEIMVSGLADDGAIVGQDSDDTYGLYNGYILRPGDEEFIPIYDFVENVDETTAEWMKETMTHTYNKYDFETGKVVPTTVIATGIPFITPDMSLIGFSQYSFWDYSDEYQYYGYLISLPPFAGVETIEPDYNETGVRSLPGGVLRIEGNIRNIEILSLNGMKVYSIVNPADTLFTGLDKGIYVVKITPDNGNIYNRKIVIR